MEFFFGAEQIIFSVSDLFNQERMVVTDYNKKESLYIYQYLFLWFSSFYFGSISYHRKYYIENNYSSLCRNCRIIKSMFFIAFISILFLKGFDLYNVYQNGYLSLYIRSEEAVWKGILIFTSTTLLLTSFSFINANNSFVYKTKYIYLLSIIDLIIGKRGEFISKIIGAFSTNKNINKLTFLKVFIYIIILFIFLNLIMVFSFRENELSYEITILDAISQLLFSQGTTLGVVSYSIIDIQSIDIRLSIKTFIPGTNFFYTLLFNEIPFYERSIGQLISFNASEGLYMNGGGLGSSVISESYLIFGYVLSLFFAFIFGYLLSFIEFKKTSTHFFRFLWIISMFLIPMLPRSGISNFTISIIIFILIYQIYKLIIYKKRCLP